LDVNNKDEKFSMSYLATSCSQEVNGVSMLHGEVTKHMFNSIWDGYSPEELHIGYVTNGVHYPTWAEKEWQDLYTDVFGEGFFQNQSDFKFWQRIHKVDDERIWNIRQNQRKQLIKYIHERLDSTWVGKREDPKSIVKIKSTLNEKALTIGFARRFATYKRGYLLFNDMDTLAKIVNNSKYPVQFIYAGKAHPNDKAGQDVIKAVVEYSKRPEFIGKVLFLENYDMALAKRLVSGVDIWLNTPTRPLEASGTSGMKAVMNGGLHFSVLDGWWVEGYRKNAGWALDQEQIYSEHNFQDQLDAEVIYRMLENEIIPLFYNRNAADVPEEWVKFIKNSISNIAPEFTMKRQLDDYINKYYLKLAKRSAEVNKNDYAMAKELAAFKLRVLHYWDNIKIEKINFFEIVKDPLYMGEEYFGEIVIDIKGLSPSDIGIELVVSENLAGRPHKIIYVKELTVMRVVGTQIHFSIEMIPAKPGNFNYGFRVFPKNSKLPHRMDFGILKWV